MKYILIIIIIFFTSNVNAMYMVVCKNMGAEYEFMFVPDGKSGSAYILKENKEVPLGEINSTKTSKGWIFELTNVHQGKKETMTWDVDLKNKSGIFKMDLVGKKQSNKAKCTDKY